MRTLKQFMLLVMTMSLVSLSSCSKSDDDRGGGSAASGTLTANVDGTSYQSIEISSSATVANACSVQNLVIIASNSDGNTLFKKPLKTGENILTMAETPQGILYITSEDASIVNLSTGDQVWNKPLKFKRADVVSSNFDEKNNRFLIASDEKLHRFDANSGTSNLLTEADFEGKEDPTSIELRDNGILLSSDQNMMLLDWDGVKSWHEYKRSPGKSAFAIVALGALALASTAAMAEANFQAGANKNYLGEYNSYGAQKQREADAFAAIGTASFNEMAKRFKSTSATQNAQFILTKLDDGVGLVKLNKDTGSLEKEIMLKNKKT